MIKRIVIIRLNIYTEKLTFKLISSPPFTNFINFEQKRRVSSAKAAGQSGTWRGDLGAMTPGGRRRTPGGRRPGGLTRAPCGPGNPDTPVPGAAACRAGRSPGMGWSLRWSGGVGPAELGADPSRSHHYQRVAGRGGASGEAAHEHIQRGFTSAVELPLAAEIVRQTALAGGHHTQQPLRLDRRLRQLVREVCCE